MIFEFFKKPLGWLVGALLFAAIMWAVFAYVTGSQRAKAEAKLGRNTTEAAQQSGKDAVESVVDQATAEDAIDRQTQENEDDIRNAEGAGAAVGSAVDRAGRASLCKRAAYRERPECVQHASTR